MPVAKVKPSPENYIPSELLQTRTVLPGDRYILSQSVDVSYRLTPEQKKYHKEAAASVTKHVRQLLGLQPDEQLEHLYPQNYHELDPHKKEIPGTGAMVYVPVVRGADGVVRQPAEEGVVWIDGEHQPAFLTDEDLAFTGRIAMQTDELGGGWVVNHLTDAESSRGHSPRARMLARELGQVTRLPQPEMPPASEIMEQSAA